MDLLPNLQFTQKFSKVILLLLNDLKRTLSGFLYSLTHRSMGNGAWGHAACGMWEGKVGITVFPKGTPLAAAAAVYLWHLLLATFCVASCFISFQFS